MSSLPIGWENRSNCMSEKDMKLGGIAATKFVNKSLSNAVAADSNASSTNSYSGASSGVYQNSDQVREHYLRQIEQQQQQDSPFSSGNRHTGNPSATPMFWEERQQMRKLEAEGFRNQQQKSQTIKAGTTPTPSVAPAAPTSSNRTATSTSAHSALVKVATHSLDSLADVLEHDNAVEISMEDRSAFAKAIQRAMQALTAASKN